MVDWLRRGWRAGWLRGDALAHWCPPTARGMRISQRVSSRVSKRLMRACTHHHSPVAAGRGVDADAADADAASIGTDAGATAGAAGGRADADPSLAMARGRD